MWTRQDHEDCDTVVLHLRIIGKTNAISLKLHKARGNIIFEKTSRRHQNVRTVSFFFFLAKCPLKTTLSFFWRTPVPFPSPLFFFRFELEEPCTEQQMVFERRPPQPPKKKKNWGVRWQQGWWRGGKKKKIKAKSAECVLSEAAAQLN